MYEWIQMIDHCCSGNFWNLAHWSQYLYIRKGEILINFISFHNCKCIKFNIKTFTIFFSSQPHESTENKVGKPFLFVHHFCANRLKQANVNCLLPGSDYCRSCSTD